MRKVLTAFFLLNIVWLLFIILVGDMSVFDKIKTYTLTF